MGALENAIGDGDDEEDDVDKNDEEFDADGFGKYDWLNYNKNYKMKLKILI